MLKEKIETYGARVRPRRHTILGTAFGVMTGVAAVVTIEGDGVREELCDVVVGIDDLLRETRAFGLKTGV